MQPDVSKDALRRIIHDQRGAVPETQWATDDAARTRLLLQTLGDGPRTIALYASRRGEPGTRQAISLLHAAGWTVLLPKLGLAPDWAAFEGWGSMRPGWGGIPEPMAPGAGPAALHDADVVVVACLAASRHGTRLGTGGGWYDRALPQRRRAAPVLALSRTQELLASLPSQTHDVPVDTVITPAGVHDCREHALPDIGKPVKGQLS